MYVPPMEKGLLFNLDVEERSETTSPVLTDYVRCLPLYFNSYGHFYNRPGYFTSRTSANDLYQVFFTESGEGSFQIGNKNYTAGKNTIVLLDCSETHLYKTKGDHWYVQWLHFGGSSAPMFYDLINPNGFVVRELKPSISLQHIFDAAKELGKNPDMLNNLKLSTYLFELMSILYSNMISVDQGSEMNERIQESMLYIQEHYNAQLTLDDLSQRAYMSKYHYLRVFKHSTSMTPYQYILQLRLSEARRLLISTKDSIDVIAQKVGFANGQTLAKRFKQQLGMTPGSFR